MKYLISKDYSPETPYYFYKTTNLINGRFYYGSGIRKNYMGSGVALRHAIKKYGPENFKHERLRYFKTRKDAYEFERRFLVIYDIKNIKKCYNQKNAACGFDYGHDYGKGIVTVKDRQDNILSVSVNDARYISGELVFIGSGKVTCKDQDGNILQVTKEEFDRRPDLVGNTIGLVSCKDRDGNTFQVTKEEFDRRPDLVGVSAGTKIKNKMPNYDNTKITINGIEFNSKKHAKEYFGIGDKKLKRLIAGEKWRDFRITINGVQYESKEDAKRKLGIGTKKINKLILKDL
jgi:hypothetical protein